MMRLIFPSFWSRRAAVGELYAIARFVLQLARGGMFHLHPQQERRHARAAAARFVRDHPDFLPPSASRWSSGS
jgi:hypothetical protein